MIFYYRYAEPFSFKTCILEEIEKSLKTEAFGSYPNLTSDCFSRQKPISQTGLKDIAWQSFGNLSELVKRPPVHSTICLYISICLFILHMSTICLLHCFLSLVFYTQRVSDLYLGVHLLT